MADLELQIPEQMKNRLGGALLFRGRRLGGQEHEVEVAERRHFAAPGAAERDDREVSGRLLEQPVRDKIVRQPNELIVQESGRLRGGAAIARFSTQSSGDFGAAIFERAAQDRRGLGVERLASAQGGEPVGQRAAVDDRRGGDRPRRWS